MNNKVVGWGAIDGGKHCRQLFSKLKNHEPDLHLMLFRKGMIKPLIRVITFTTIEDVNYFSKLLESKSQDIKATTPVYVTGCSNKATQQEIEIELAKKGAYVSYNINTEIECAEDITSIFSCGELAEQLLERNPSFKTHEYWTNRSRELIYKMRANQSTTHSEWLKEKALDIETMIDIYSRNTHYGKPCTLKAVNELIDEISERFNATENLEILSDDDKLSFAIELVN